jgi:hypothetical protein
VAPTTPAVLDHPTSVTWTAEDAFTCVPGPTIACLLNGRFQVGFAYRLPGGADEWAIATKLTDDTVAFAFNEAPNTIQAVASVLNACVESLGDHYWVFAAFLTNVNFNLSVTDAHAGVNKAYGHPAGPAAQAVQDTAALATCP